MKSIHEYEKEQVNAKTNKHSVRNRLLSIIKLSAIREQWNLRDFPQPDLLGEILSLAKKEAQEIGAQFYFVYLPQWERFRENGKAKGDQFHRRQKVLELVKSLDIPIIDFYEPFKRNLTHFPFKKYGHYNKDGYKLLAEEIFLRLKKDGVL